MARLLSVILFICVGCKSQSASQSAYPVVVVDDAHLQFKHADGSKAVFYAVPPGPGVVLDASSYKFQIPPQLAVSGPDSVSIVIGKGQMYSADWKPVDGKQVLDAATLKPVGKAPPFTGFPAGVTIAMGIGHASSRETAAQLSV